MLSSETAANADGSPDLPQVQPGAFLTMHYRLGGSSGDIVNTFNDKPATLTLGSGELAPAIEARLIGQPEGARLSFELQAGEAFGERNPDLLQWVKRRLLSRHGDPLEKYQIGEVVEFPTPDGRGTYAGVVRELRETPGAEAVLFDFNHPLAGQALTFEAHIIGVL
jgi:FKBP-type peptidyl-prolyl cis-trans isomerase SlpA